jgi:hypothetical protein
MGLFRPRSFPGADAVGGKLGMPLWLFHADSLSEWLLDEPAVDKTALTVDKTPRQTIPLHPGLFTE